MRSYNRFPGTSVAQSVLAMSSNYSNLNESLSDENSESGYLNNLPILIPMAISLYSLSFITFFGNALVLHAIRTERRLQTVSNMFIMSLAVSDLVVGLCVMPISSAYAISGEWKFGVFVCQFWLSVDYTASTASILNLLILSFDRYWSIKSPLKYLRRRTKKRASIMLTIVWLSSALWLVPIQFWHMWYNDGMRKIPENVCETEFADNLAIKMFTSVLNFYVPMCLLIVVYFRIYREIKKRSSLELGVCCSSSDYVPNADISESTSDDVSRIQYISNERTKVERYNNLTILCLDGRESSLSSKEEIIGEIKVNVEIEGKDDSETESLSHIRSGLHGPRRYSLADAYRTVRRFCNQKLHGHRRRDRLELNVYSNMHRSNYQTNTNLCSESKVSGKKKKPKSAKHRRQIGQNLRSEKKAARQLGVILSAFILCWLPYSVFFLIIAYCSDCIDVRIHTASIWLGYMNSTMNPVIYPLCNTKFKRAFKRILRVNNSSANVTNVTQNQKNKNLD